MPELVMVIEDEKEIRDLVRYNLERAGFRVASSDDGEQGLGAEPSREARTIEAGALRIDPASHEATWRGRRLELTPREFDLLAFLARSPGRVHSREELLRKVCGYDYVGETRTGRARRRSRAIRAPMTTRFPPPFMRRQPVGNASGAFLSRVGSGPRPAAARSRKER